MSNPNHRHKILSKLIDRHEAAGGGRDISLPFTKRFYPDYFDAQDHSAKDEINSAAVSLERDGLALVEWLRFSDGHELKRIILMPESVDRAYAEVGRQPKEMIIEDAVRMIEEFGATGGLWFKDACKDAAASLRRGDAFFSLKAVDTGRLSDVLKTLRAIADLKEETVLKRRLSANILGDSKALARFESVIADILRHYGVSDCGNDREVLESAGVITKPDMTLISGEIVLNLGGSLLDINSVKPFMGLPTTALPEAGVVSVSADYVITIENETSFYDYVTKVDEQYIAVFLSGYPNAGRISLLKAIERFASVNNLRLPFYHWGDIDFGGYDIIRSYREKSGIHVIPHLMGPELAEASPYSVRLEESKRRRLEGLAASGGHEDLSAMAAELIRTGKRLEQENVEAEGIV